MLRQLCIIGVSAAFLSGCFNLHQSQAPIAKTYPISHQQKMQAAHHWDVLAEHQAQLLMESDFLSGKAFYIHHESNASPFSQGFDSLLTSQLVNSGAHVRTEPMNTALINYKVQVVRHKDRGYIRAPEGAWTALTASVGFAAMAYNTWSEPALALIPFAAAADLWSGDWTSETSSEVIITTQVTEHGRVLYSASNIYYINPGDSDHYQARRSVTKAVPVTGTW
ncbi:hypothetical protein [Nitrincola sp. MINF-07-Sa-05]|uniref:hypothetical protein n=1 Tax=Nitrincola salilacus TaxID=3400273 RepID=UPI003917E88C